MANRNRSKQRKQLFFSDWKSAWRKVREIWNSGQRVRVSIAHLHDEDGNGDLVVVSHLLCIRYGKAIRHPQDFSAIAYKFFQYLQSTNYYGKN